MKTSKKLPLSRWLGRLWILTSSHIPRYATFGQNPNPSQASDPYTLKFLRNALLLLMPLALLLCLCGCGSKQTAQRSDSVRAGSELSGVLPDTLVIGTLYSPSSYFIYRDEPMGYEYELAQKFAREKGMGLKVKVADNFHELIEMLDSGRVDLLAYEIPKTAEYKAKVLHCGPENETHQVLVQPAPDGKPAITDVTQLPGKRVYVEKDSKYFYRLQNLNKEVGGGIQIVPIDKDSVITEDMIDMVANGQIPLTVIDSDIARVSHTYYDDIDVNLPIGMAQSASWAVAPDNEALAQAIDEWGTRLVSDPDSKDIYRRYYEKSKKVPEGDSSGHKSPKMRADGSISEFDPIFRRYAKEIGWDWRLLAAQAYHESRFNVNAVSWAGARGLMQLMPRTAAAMGLDPSKASNPELNVQAAVKHIARVDKQFADKVPDKNERLKFIIAAYNSGGAHILDAIQIAINTGRNPRQWFGHVEQALLLKSKPEYYRGNGVKYGYFKGTQTVNYVKDVMDTYEFYKQHVKL